MGIEMQRNIAVVAALICVALPLWVSLTVTAAPGFGPLPEFDQTDVRARKAAFFGFLRPIVRYQNGRIQAEREWMLSKLDSAERGWLDDWRWRRLAARYRIPADLPEDQIAALLLRRVHVVPESLVLAQAAKESGWGRSRFSREGNALFGQRCFSQGCGMLPRRRVAGARHEVEAFATVAASVESYLLNLNTHDRYVELRRERQRLRKADEPVRGSRLARFATSYSERRDKYVVEVMALIATNGLESPVSR